MKYVVVKRVEFEYHIEADSKEDALKRDRGLEPNFFDVNVDVEEMEDET